MARRSVAEFLGQFVLPLVRGGELTVGRPIDAEDMRAFEDDLPHASVELVEVDEARADVLSALVVRPPALVLGVDELRLAAAVYNLLFLAHPRVDTWAIGKGGVRKVVEAAKGFASQPLTRDRTRVLARHALLHNIFDLSRRDTVVSWWTGSARFRGQEPPGRLTAWSSVRKVKTRIDQVGFHELLATPDSTPTIGLLLRRSPLTVSLGAPEGAPPVRWEEVVFLLRDAELARALAHEALAPAEPEAVVAAPARYAAGLEQMLERNPAEADVRAVAGFLVHLSALLALAELKQRDVDAPSALLTHALAPERAGQRLRGLSTFFALPNALALVDARLAEPPGLRDDERLGRRWDCHRRQVLTGVGEAVIDTLAARIAKHLGANLLKPAPPEPVEVGDNPR